MNPAVILAAVVLSFTLWYFRVWPFRKKKERPYPVARKEKRPALDITEEFYHK